MVTFIFYAMHLSVQFNHFNHALWVAVRCEASEATPTVAIASEATCTIHWWIGEVVSALPGSNHLSHYHTKIKHYSCIVIHLSSLWRYVRE